MGEAGPWNAQSLKRKITLAEARNELATHSHGQQRRQQHASDGATEYQCAMTHDPVEHRCVAIARGTHQAVVLLLHFTGDKKGNSSGYEGDRENHGAQQCDYHRECHGVEHLPLDTGERKDRQVDHHDDQLAVDQRTPCLLGRREYFVETLTAGQNPAMFFLGVGKPADCVFDDDHRTVDDDAEVECP